MLNKKIVPGQLVYWKNEAVLIMELKGHSEVIVRIVNGGKTDIARVSDLKVNIEPSTSESHKHLLSSEKEWDTAISRYEIILPLLNKVGRTESDVLAIAREHGKGITTIYRWLKRFEETGLVSSLLRQPRNDKGLNKLDQEVEELIKIQIDKIYLKAERPSVLKLFRIIKSECIKSDLPIPHKNTVYARIKDIEEKELVRKRVSPKQSKQMFYPITGQFPGADYPNAVVQVDHTKVDLIIVDEEHRMPIGRPFLTITIDIATNKNDLRL